ncbi:MAG TPA: hypothetical protein VE547_22510, partial [Mycobacteriales bacterium]|nr:hypothetical protein [Mycobacteriales bacterium]
ILNLHWPALAGFVQPLSGEYAARRGLLEQLPFPTGYGVEIGKLGRMSSEILQVVFERLRREGRLTMDPPETELTQFERSEQDYLVHTVDMAPAERPPLLSVPEYRARVRG